MAKVSTLACDNCMAVPATTVLVAIDVDPELEVDLCKDCKDAFMSFLRKGRKAKPTRQYRSFAKTTDFEV